jgi:hypothetical protein
MEETYYKHSKYYAGSDVLKPPTIMEEEGKTGADEGAFKVGKITEAWYPPYDHVPMDARETREQAVRELRRIPTGPPLPEYAGFAPGDTIRACLDLCITAEYIFQRERTLLAIMMSM